MSERRWLMLTVIALPALLGCELVAGIEERALDAGAGAGGVVGSGGSGGGRGGDLLCGGAEPPQCLDDLVDDFDDGNLNLLWAPGGDVQPVAGQLRFPLSTDAKVYADLKSRRSYILRGCEITLEITEAPNYGAAARANFGLTVGRGNGNDVFISVGDEAGQIFGIEEAGQQPLEYPEVFELAFDRWWRIRERDGTVSIATSGDGVTWNVALEGPSPSYIDEVCVYFWAGTIAAHPNPGAVAVDNVNLLP